MINLQSKTKGLRRSANVISSSMKIERPKIHEELLFQSEFEGSKISMSYLKKLSRKIFTEFLVVPDFFFFFYLSLQLIGRNPSTLGRETCMSVYRSKCQSHPIYTHRQGKRYSMVMGTKRNLPYQYSYLKMTIKQSL